MIQISILTGAGFSKPASIPDVAKLNEKFIKHSDTSKLEKEYREFRPTYYYKEKLFYMFIKFYLLKLKSDIFNYETFFDDIIKLKEKDNLFFNEFIDFISQDIFLKEYAIKRDKNNIANDFRLKVNQIVKNLLELESNQIGRYSKYDNLFKLIESCILSNVVINFYTLNHDTLFEFLIKQQSKTIQGEFCDGFEAENSKFIGYNQIFNKDEKVREYTGVYSGRFRYIKLHGGIGNYFVYPMERNGEYFLYEKKMVDIGPSIDDVTDLRNIESEMDVKFEAIPVFLTGKENKLSNYDNEPIYNSKISLIKKSLEESQLLILIGYGCGDNPINEILINHYLKKGGKMIITSKGELSIKKFEPYKNQIEVYNEGLENFDFTALLNH